MSKNRTDAVQKQHEERWNWEMSEAGRQLNIWWDGYQLGHHEMIHLVRFFLQFSRQLMSTKAQNKVIGRKALRRKASLWKWIDDNWDDLKWFFENVVLVLRSGQLVGPRRLDALQRFTSSEVPV
jgi:hypothetical protein